MEKEKLTGFISRYNLGGCIETVKVVSDELTKRITTSFVSEEKFVLGTVSLLNEHIGTRSMGIYDTTKLKSLLKVLNSEISVTGVQIDDRVISLQLSDSTTSVNFMLSDLSVIPQMPVLKGLPEWDVVIDLTKDFVTRFIKAKDALKEAMSFTLVRNKKSSKIELVIGYSSINSNRISMDVDIVDNKSDLTSTISFSAKYLREILVANIDSTDSQLKVSCKGLANIKFSSDTYTSEYYLTAIPQTI